MRTIEEIYQSLLKAYAQRTGRTLAEDCDLAVRFYAAAAQLQALDIQTWWVLDQCFPQTAQGTYLDGHAMMRGHYPQRGYPGGGNAAVFCDQPSISGADHRCGYCLHDGGGSPVPDHR